MPKYSLSNPAKDYYESECTFFNIDLYSLGYTKKFINPDVRVTYNINIILNQNIIYLHGNIF